MTALVMLIDSAIKGNPDSTGNHRLTDLMCLLCARKYEVFTGAKLNFNVVVRPCSGELEVVFHSVLEALTISEVHPRFLRPPHASPSHMHMLRFKVWSNGATPGGGGRVRRRAAGPTGRIWVVYIHNSLP